MTNGNRRVERGLLYAIGRALDTLAIVNCRMDTPVHPYAIGVRLSDII